MTTEGRRPRRVAEQVRAHLSVVLTTELEDPRLAGIAVTKVSVTPDLGYADVYVRMMVDVDERGRGRVLSTLARASGHLRKGLAPVLRVKRVPDLRFHYDTDPDARARVDELLREWHEQQDDPTDD